MAGSIPICILKANIQCCNSCPKKVHQKLMKIHGVTSVDVNQETGLITVTGARDASILIKAIKKAIGRNAELLKFEMKSAEEQQGPNSTDNSSFDDDEVGEITQARYSSRSNNNRSYAGHSSRSIDIDNRSHVGHSSRSNNSRSHAGYSSRSIDIDNRSHAEHSSRSNNNRSLARHSSRSIDIDNRSHAEHSSRSNNNRSHVEYSSRSNDNHSHVGHSSRSDNNNNNHNLRGPDHIMRQGSSSPNSSEYGSAYNYYQPSPSMPYYPQQPPHHYHRY